MDYLIAVSYTHLLKMLGLALISMFATVMVGFLGSRIAARLARDLRNQVFKKVVDFSESEMKQFSTASLITRSTNDIQQVQMSVSYTHLMFVCPR